jgi:hypothetical protein
MPAIKITRDHPNLVITVEAEECADSPEISFYDPRTKTRGEPSPGFADSVRKIVDRAEWPWGWCDVTVTVRLCDIKGEAYLSQCAYENEEDFVKNSGYYDQMLSEAFAELQENIDITYAAIHED